MHVVTEYNLHIFVGVCHLEHKIDEISELRKIGCNLQDKFDSLVLAVKKSLENDGIDVEDAKILIKVRLKRKARVIPRLMPCIDILEKVNDFNSLFEFLSKYDIIGYLNYKLLKKLSELVKDDDEINRLFFYYEEEYAKLLSSASIQDFIPYFKKESDLSHTTPLAKCKYQGSPQGFNFLSVWWYNWHSDSTSICLDKSIVINLIRKCV